MAKSIRQTAHFDAPPHAVFEALMDGERHAAFTGDAARIVRKIGGTFSTFGGYATGKTLKLEKTSSSCSRGGRRNSGRATPIPA